MKKEKEQSINEIDENEEYLMPADCEESEQEIESISVDERKTHYTLINLFALTITALVAAAVFLLLTGEKKPAREENPLMLKTFLSGHYTRKIEDSYVKSLPYPYEFKNGGEKIRFLFGIGNKIKKYKDVEEEIVIVSDDEIEKKKVSIKENKEKALDDQTTKTKAKPATTTKKTTAKKKSKTQKKDLTTTTRATTATTTTTTEKRTVLTTTNNNAPNVVTTTTVPPAVTYNYDSKPEDSSSSKKEEN